ncbi:hypothetical protein NLU13_0052 [Sarocladium strictum]|uniref:Nephrocystin 3-like N-terminal domain-containing protein n=1 Tax=Sarocladium strictum TaxID=5046 RepID=A0AA39GNC1_SARSR|nr:hypothetical protein NLU13_0052 [Sarocladium strictum]
MPGSDNGSADKRSAYSSPSISNVDSEEDNERKQGLDANEANEAASVSASERSAKGTDVVSGASQTAGAEEVEDAKSEAGESHKSHVSEPAPPPKVRRGLLVEDKLEDRLPAGDLVIIHGLNETSWYLEPVPDTGSRGSTAWLSQHAGYIGWQYLSYFFPISSKLPNTPAPFYRNGIEDEARLLLDGIIAYRDDLKTRYSEEDVDQRPVNFIAHDIGGTIVKKALHIAALNPDKYGDIAYCTTCLIFLGCPHRSTARELQDTLTKLIYMPENKWQPGLLDGIVNLAEAVEYTNGEFYDTNMLIRASILNIYNMPSTDVDGEDTLVQAPFSEDQVTLDAPWEYFKMCSIPHHELVDGGLLDEGTTDKHFAQTIRNEKDEFPTGVVNIFGTGNSQKRNDHKLFLSMAPPCRPTQPTQFFWQPHSIQRWFVGLETYKEWYASTGIGILHVYGNSHLTIKSQELYGHFHEHKLIPNMIYFEFCRHDSRFNTLEAMLKTFVAHIITRVPQRNAAQDDYHAMIPLLRYYDALSLTDLMHMFRTMLMWRHIPPLVFMTACLDECDSGKHRLLGLIYSLRELTEMKHRFIITTLPEEGLMSRLVGNYSINLDDFDTSANSAWTDTFEKTYDLHLGLLVDERPVFRPLMPHVREILALCGTDAWLGHLIVRWLAKKKAQPGRDTIRDAERLLNSLEPVTADRVLNTIVHAFGAEVERAKMYLDWVTVAFRPLTLQELGTAVEFTESPTQETLDYIDFYHTRKDIERFGMVFCITDNVVDLWLPYYVERMHYDESETERAHGRISEVLLDYLLMESVQKTAVEFCGRFKDPLAVVPFAPKDTLVSYAVQFWTMHYSKAGSSRPLEKAKTFFNNVQARNAWWWLLQLLRPAILRYVQSFLSPLPYVASTGLEDLIQAQLLVEADSKTLKQDAGAALIQAALNGHRIAMAMVSKHTAMTEELFQEVMHMAALNESPNCVEETLKLASAASLKLEVSPVILCRTIWVGWKDITESLYGALARQDKKIEFPVQPLHLAVEHGDKDLVEMVLGWTEGVNSRDTWGRTALHLAASMGDPAIIRSLLASGADIEAELGVEDRGSLTPLQLATASGNHLALDVLLEKGAKVNIGSSELVGTIGSFFEAPPLVYAAGMGFVKCIKVLLQHEPDLALTVNNCSALWYAVEGGRLEIARLLLEAQADPNENPEDHDMLLFMPVQEKNHALLDLLLEHNANVNQESSWDTSRRTPLARAAGTGDLDMFAKLLDKGADPNLVGENSQSPLYVASYNGHHDIVSLLLEKGARVNTIVESSHWSALHAAYDEPALVGKLLEAGANINALADSGTTLYLAAKCNQIETVKLLLEKEADVEIATQRINEILPEEEFGMTPLCIACYRNNLEVIRALLQAGANVNHMCKDEKTGEDRTFPLKLCVDSGFDDALEILLEARASGPGAADIKLSANGTSVLHCINTDTSLAMVKSLVVAGAEIEALNNANHSPLIIAMEAGNIEVSEYLITKGANVNHHTPGFRTPLHIACENAEYKLFKALIDYGASVSRADSSAYHSTLLGALAGAREDWTKVEEIAKYLIEEAGVDVNARCRKPPHLPLCRAAHDPALDMVKYLMGKGADVNAEDAWGMRPVHFAAWYSWSMYTIIRENENLKDPFPLNKLKMSPLHYAAGGGVWDDGFDEILRKAGASVHDKDEDGWDAIMWAAKTSYNDPDTIEAILKRANDDALWVKGYVTGEQLWSPLKCSKYFGATQVIYDLLTPPQGRRTRILETGEEEVWNPDSHESREAEFQWLGCDMCFDGICGFAYYCASCDIDLCYKCHRSREKFDPGHEYEKIGPEFPEQEENTESGGDAATGESSRPGREVVSDPVSVDYSSDEDTDDGADDEDSIFSDQ